MSTTAKVMFVIPEEVFGLAELVSELGGEFEDANNDPLTYLAAHIGEVTSIVFSDCHDPIDDIKAVTEELTKHGSPYFAVTDSFTEPSRGIRRQATVVLNITGTVDGEKSQNFPWERGEPDVNEESLAVVGATADEIEAMTERFFPNSLPSRRLGS